MAAVDEESPLLSAEVSGAELYHPSMHDNIASAPPFQREAPPPYWAVPAAGSTSICCGVCGAQIVVNTKSNQHVQKCSVCQEATPIGSPPAGKRFVRCECHCLLLCKISSQKVMCPRPHCKRVIEMTAPVSSVVVVQCYTMRAVCGHCSQTFTSPQSGAKTRVRCPHCRKVSFIGQEYPIHRCVRSSLMAIFFAILTGGLIAGTVEEARDYNAIYAAWAFLLVLFVVCVCWAVYWARIKISTPLHT